MTIPADLRYTREHEWMREEEGVAVVGVTDHAQEALGDIVFVELPEVGARVEAGKPYAVVESVKAVSDVYAPVTGEVIAVNEALNDAPEKINTDCYGEGWIAKIRIEGETVELLDADAYALYLEE